MNDQLIATGLNEQQASAYALLLETGGVSPPTAAKKLDITRSNAYKVLDRLVELSLAVKHEKGKKLIYYPDNPMNLSSLVAEQRNIAAAREDAVKNVLSDLLAQFHAHTDRPTVTIVSGVKDVANAYRTQIQQLQPIYFLRSRSDIPVMGFDTMHDIRIMPARHGVNRYGITPDKHTGTTLSKGDQRSNLTRTWVKEEDYTAPVEWSVSGSSLVIIVFGTEPHAITIDNPIIATAFLQVWKLLDTCLRQMSYYPQLPR